MKTKYGDVKLDNKGYYIITSIKEGNILKSLHRLVFEDYHNCKLDENDIIHHIDGNKKNNHPTNLICMSKKGHAILHNRGKNHPMYGKHHSEETRKKLSEINKGKNHPMYGKHHSEESRKKISKANKGKIFSDEHKMKLSETKNNSGYLNVSKRKSKTCKQGFIWRYSYYEDNKRKEIASISLKKLETKVKAKGLPWKKFKKKIDKNE